MPLRIAAYRTFHCSSTHSCIYLSLSLVRVFNLPITYTNTINTRPQTVFEENNDCQLRLTSDVDNGITKYAKITMPTSQKHATVQITEIK